MLLMMMTTTPKYNGQIMVHVVAALLLTFGTVATNGQSRAVSAAPVDNSQQVIEEVLSGFCALLPYIPFAGNHRRSGHSAGILSVRRDHRDVRRQRYGHRRSAGHAATGLRSVAIASAESRSAAAIPAQHNDLQRTASVGSGGGGGIVGVKLREWYRPI